jgi:predicted outer membrane repeat protein
VFYNNVASHGGAIFMQYNTNEIHFSGDKFISNHATNNGGAVSFNGDYSITKITFNDCEFEGNAAQYDSAIHIDSDVSDILIDNCVFNNNEASGSGNVGFNYYTSDATIKNSNFTNNNCAVNGGAIQAYYAVSNITVDNCIFNSNQGAYGSAIAIHGSNDDFNIINSKFISNSGTYGAVYFKTSSNVYLYNNVFESNVASHGAAIYFDYQNTNNIKVVKCQFLDNQASVKGGAIGFGYTNTISVRTSTFDGNSAQSGGALYINQYSNKVKMFRSVFENNVATSHFGSVLCSDSVSATASHVHFLGSTLSSNSGTEMCDWTSYNMTDDGYTSYALVDSTGSAYYVKPLLGTLYIHIYNIK